MEESFFSLHRKEWESDFFSFPIGSLTFRFPAGAGRYFRVYPELRAHLTSLLKIADAQYQLLEIDLDTKLMFAVPLFEEHGFRLVDSRCRFLTLLDKNNLNAQLFGIANDQIQIREKKEGDFEQIAGLTVNFLVNDDSFLSRYKNAAFFREGLAETYFLEWIRNTFHSPDAVISVATKKSGEVIAFFIYEKQGSRNHFPVYKGILSVVHPEFRGIDLHLALQSFIFGRIEERVFYVDNTTQLANTGVIRNHMKSRRTLERVSFVLWRTSPAEGSPVA